jgi:hypothetical protein
MTTDEVIHLLGTFEKRLDAIAGQAQKALDLTGKLRDDVTQIRNRLLSTTETQTHPTANRPPK